MKSLQRALASLLLLSICNLGSSQRISHPCTANGGVPGICLDIKRCSSALGYLRANITLPSCNPNDPRYVCCPTGKRLSANMCEEYQNKLRQSSIAFPLLPLPFIEDLSPVEVKCDKHIAFISDGRPASIDEMPFMVAVGYNVNNIPWRCGGTLISDEFVLTAAHCVTNQFAGPPTKLLLGDITLSKTTSSTRELVGVSKVFTHPLYKPPLTYHDIALIQMSRKVNITKSIRPACLPQAEDDLLRKINSKNFTAAGFGITGAGEAQSDTLQVVNLNGYSWEGCNAFYKEISTSNIKFPQGITRTQLCAGDGVGRKDTCQGDSGGPLLLPDKVKNCIFYVVGITSFGPNQCGETVPAIYTNVLSYLDWIEDVVWRTNKA